MIENYKNKIDGYIKAKDTNKPHLMKSVFSEDATLKMEVKSANISFPSRAIGRDEITQILVQEFNDSYENIYTICLLDTLKHNEYIVNCRWLVGMTEKSSGTCKVGFGSYEWVFDERAELVSSLTIDIEQMFFVPKQNGPQIMSWFEGLSYPWALSSNVISSLPEATLIDEIFTDFVKPIDQKETPTMLGSIE